MNHMNDYSNIENVPRNQTLIIVEGKLEKYFLLKMLLKSFPEIPIQLDHVQVYESDIYDLYHAIEKEYGESWFEEGLEINVPYLISLKNNIVPALEKKNFVNIIMMFDYERHDNLFSNEKILRMQKYFDSVDDQGLLYINYPMVESLYHYKAFPDKDYIDRCIPVAFKPGRLYKEKVKEESVILEDISLYDKLFTFISSRIKGSKLSIENISENLLSVNNMDELQLSIDAFLNQTNLSHKNKANLKFNIEKLLSEQSYMEKGISYWKEMRYIFKIILEHNVIKANYIQEGVKDDTRTIKEKYLSLEWAKILNKQNEFSQDPANGIIMVLCTCITFLGEYKFFWNSSSS